MYNIHNNYQNILSLIKKNNINLPIMGYLFPFGSTKIENIEFIGNNIHRDHMFDAIFFCYDQEPLIYDYNQIIFNYIKNTVSHMSTQLPQETYVYSKTFNSKILVSKTFKNVKHKLPVILLNTEKHSKEKNKLLEEYNFIDCYYFFHGLAAADWYRGYEYAVDILPLKERTITKKFINFNRITGNARVYRSFFVAELVKRNLVEFGNISYSRTCPEHGDLTPTLIKAKINYNLPSDYIKQTLNLLTTTLTTDLRIDTAIDLPINNDSFTIGPVNQSIESFLHVVTETCFWEEKQHLTEKIFKPIVLKQPFVLLGCANNLAYLKEYGFKTFDRWWDESYDTCQDPIQRINMVCDIIENICQRSNHELHNLLLEMEDVLEYNYNRFYSKEFVQDIWNELATNLESAIARLPHPTSLET